MKESKLTYVALTLAAAAVVITGVSTGLSALPNSARINALTQEVNKLKQSNEGFVQQLEVERQNRPRIDELDVGLTAIATVLKIDRAELAKAISVAKRAREEVVPRQSTLAAPQPYVAPDASVAGVAQEPPQQTAATMASGVGGSLAIGDKTGTSAPKAPKDTSNLTGPLGSDNPFVSTADGAEAPAALTIAATTQVLEPLSIDQVDAVLGKRISENWYKPAGAADNLSAVVQVQMARNGKVSAVKLTKASGNTAFDNSAISALKSIGSIEEVKRLSDADFKKGYAVRSIQFTPQMGG